jgi:hypothetical protein
MVIALALGKLQLGVTNLESGSVGSIVGTGAAEWFLLIFFCLLKGKVVLFLMSFMATSVVGSNR